VVQSVLHRRNSKPFVCRKKVRRDRSDPAGTGLKLRIKFLERCSGENYCQEDPYGYQDDHRHHDEVFFQPCMNVLPSVNSGSRCHLLGPFVTNLLIGAAAGK